MRICGVVLPVKKVVRFALRRIYGIGAHRAALICEEMSISDATRVKDLSDLDAIKIKDKIEEKEFLIGPDLQRSVNNDLKRLISNGCLRGRRHLAKLPVRGQRTKSNAKSARRRKGLA